MGRPARRVFPTLLGLAFVAVVPSLSAGQASEGLGEEIWQGNLDPEAKAKMIAGLPRSHGEVTLVCSPITVRVYPDGRAALTNAECTVTLIARKPQGMTYSKRVYTVQLDAVVARSLGELETTRRVSFVWDYIQDGRAKHETHTFMPRPESVTIRERGPDRLLSLKNTPDSIPLVPWRLFGHRREGQRPDCGPIGLAPTQLPDGMVGVAYRQRLEATGGTAPYTLELSAGVAPEGVTMSWLGVVAGTPTTAGTYFFMVRATDLHECVAVQRYTLTIRAADEAPPERIPPPPRRVPGPGQGPYHEFAALCRIGWASALARFSVGPADPTIVGHLQAAGEHLQAANQNTFAPLKAWPNWRSDAGQLTARADQLTRGGDPVRASLGPALRQHAQSLINELAIQQAGEVVRRPSCDSLYAALGYQMCYTQQAFQIAEAAERQGDHRLQQAATTDGQQLVGSVLRVLNEMPTLPLATGRCIDLGEIATTLSGDSAGAPIDWRVTTHNQAVARILAILGGQGLAPLPEPIPASWLAADRCGPFER